MSGSSFSGSMLHQNKNSAHAPVAVRDGESDHAFIGSKTLPLINTAQEK